MLSFMRFAGATATLSFALGVAGAQVSPTLDIPKLTGIAIDGRGADWGKSGLVATPLFLRDDPIPAGHGFSGTLRIGWDDRGLLLLAEVADPDADEADDIDQLYAGDAVEFFLAPSQRSGDVAQLVVGAGMDPKHQGLRVKAFDHRVTPSLLKTPLRIEAMSSKSATGYTVEALIPWSDIGIRPRLGATFAFQFNVNDTTGKTHTRMLWFPRDGAWGDAHATHLLRLARKAGPSPKAVAAAAFVGGKLVLNVAAVPELAGMRVEAQGGGQVLGSTTLAREGRRATGTINLPLEPSTKPSASISVLAIHRGNRRDPFDGRIAETLWTVVMPDYLRDAIRGLGESHLTVSDPIFSGTSFPSVDFEQPESVKSQFGSYTIKTTYFDSAGRRVETAVAPGRYGALAEVSIDGAHKFYRAFELFHAAAPVDWAAAAKLSKKDFLVGLGLDSRLAEQAAFGGRTTRVGNTLEIASEAAEVQVADPAMPVVEVPFQSYSYKYRLRRNAGAKTIYNVIVSLPEGYAKSTAPVPLLLFLHGSGERGDDIDLVGNQGPQAERAGGMKLPFIIVSPQCPYGEWWNARALMVLLDEIEAKYHVDKTRVYVTGLSMGGFGTWELATDYPERFAAVAPIAGGGDPLRVARMKSVPVWAFHGALDDVVPITGDQATVDALKAAGGDVTFTVYPTRHHDSWLPAYDDRRLYEWLLSHRLRTIQKRGRRSGT